MTPEETAITNKIAIVIFSIYLLMMSYLKYDEDDKFSCLFCSFFSGLLLGIIFILHGLGKV